MYLIGFACAAITLPFQQALFRVTLTTVVGGSATESDCSLSTSVVVSYIIYTRKERKSYNNLFASIVLLNDRGCIMPRAYFFWSLSLL